MAYPTYENKCGSCEYLDINNYSSSKDKCKCEKRGGYHYFNEDTCYAYSGPVPDGKDSDERDYRELYYRWYVVTTIFEQLNLTCDYECIKVLQEFRINVLEQDAKYADVLKEYDVIGSFLARLLKEDNDAKKMCKSLLNVYLVRILDLIKDKDYEKALNLYTTMLNLLCSIYGLEKKNSTYYLKRK